MVSTNILATAYAGIGNYQEAYKYVRLYEEIRHQLFFNERDKQINELKTKYETEQKDRKIAEQQLVLANSNHELKRKNYFVLFFIILFVLAVVFIIYMAITHKKLKKAHLLLQEQNQQILNHKYEIEKYSNEISVAYQKLKSLEQHRQAMINMIVHDLKSPLGVLSNIDIFESEEERLAVIKAISKQMTNLVLNMLDINKTENEKLNLNRTECSPNEIVNKAIADVDFFIKSKNITIVNKVSQNTVINAGKEIFLRVIVNLLSNAIKFSDSNSNIEVFSKVS